MNQLKLWQKNFRGNLELLARSMASGHVHLMKAKHRTRCDDPSDVIIWDLKSGRQRRFSQHQYHLARDLYVSPKSAYSVAGGTWQKMGGYWNPQYPHHFAFFQPTQWQQIVLACGPKGATQTTRVPSIFGTPVELPPQPMPTFPGIPTPGGYYPPITPPQIVPSAPIVGLNTGLPASTLAATGLPIAGSVFNPIQPRSTTMTGPAPISSVAVIPVTAGR